MRILEFFGIRKPSRFDLDVDAALKQWRLKHAEATECLVCSALETGIDPRRLELVSEQRGFQMVTYIQVKK